ncbi:N-acetylmuramoyl-L-alanine amidase [compost metagenome]
MKPYPNNCTIGIECTHIDSKGKMTDATYDTLVEFSANLCKTYKLNPLTDLWLHKEVVGWKDCHLWFVNNPKEWASFKQKVKNKVDGVSATVPKTPAPVVTNPNQWKIDLGQAAVKYLASKGIIDNPENWMDKMLDAPEDWLVFELLKRISK